MRKLSHKGVTTNYNNKWITCSPLIEVAQSDMAPGRRACDAPSDKDKPASEMYHCLFTIRIKPSSVQSHLNIVKTSASSVRSATLKLCRHS